jgi:hypothetical protein
MISKSQPGSNSNYGAFSSFTTGWINSADVGYDEMLDYALNVKAVQTPNWRSITDGSNYIEHTNGRGRFNYCRHAKSDLTVYETASPACRITNTLFQGGKTYHSWAVYYGTDAVPLEPSDFEADDLLTEAYRKRAFQGVLPKLNDGFSLFNFIMELPELPRLALQILSAKKLIKKLMSFGADGRKTLAELHLAYQFGVKPLLSDLEGIVDNLLESEKKVNDFIQRGKTPKPYHYREIEDVAPYSLQETRLGQIMCKQKTILSSTLLCTYTYKKPSFLDGWAEIMGLYPTPKRIWDAIPFSFLIDWVFKIGDMLAQLDIDENLKIKLLDYCDSVKVETVYYGTRNSYDYLWQFDPAYFGLVFLEDRATQWEWKKSVYLRVPSAPNTGFALPATDELSGRELVLGGALLLA